MITPFTRCVVSFALFSAFSLAAFQPVPAHAAGAQMAGNRLTIGGTDIGETFYVEEKQGRGYYTRYGKYIPGETFLRVRIIDNRTGEQLLQKYFRKDEVASIGVFANGGNDTIEIHTDVGAGLFGGHGDDNMLGGGGDDYIDAGPGLIDVIDGGRGNDVLYSGQKWYIPFTSSPYTLMRGGEGSDTFIYRNSDYLKMDDNSGFGWMIAPDYTFGANDENYAGMHLIME